MKQHIWLLNHYACLPGKGMGLRHYNFAKELVKRGYDVHIFASSAGHNTDFNAITDNSSHRLETVNGVDFVYVKTSGYMGNNLKRIKNILQYTFKLPGIAKTFAKVNKPDVIIGSSMHPLTLFVGRRIAKKLKCEYIVEIRDLWPESLKSYYPDFNEFLMNIFRSVEKFIYKRAKNIIFTMEGGRNYIVDREWQNEIPLDKIAYINNGIDLETFIYNNNSFRITDPDLEDSSTFKVVYTGSIRRTNAVGVLIEVAALLKKRGVDDVRLLVWGDGDELPALKAETDRQALDNIVFKGVVPKEYIPYIVSAADLNLLHQIRVDGGVNKYGSSQNKKYDYLAAGKPVLCTVKSNYDVIKDRNAGLSLEFQTPESIAEGILFFRDMPKADYAGYCQRARKAVEDFDFVKLTDTLVSVIESH